MESAPRLITLRGGYDKNFSYLYAAPAGSSTANDAILIDAAVSAEETLAAAAEHGLRIRKIFITHSHPDHWSSAPDLLKEVDAEIVFFRGLAEKLAITASRVVEVGDGDTIDFGERSLRLLHTPGHDPTHLCLHDEEGRALFTGDTLFVGRTGRTKQPGSDPRELYRSLRDRIAPLPGVTRFFPGHDYGPLASRTLAEERSENAFLRANSEEEFVQVMEEYERSRE